MSVSGVCGGPLWYVMYWGVTHLWLVMWWLDGGACSACGFLLLYDSSYLSVFTCLTSLNNYIYFYTSYSFSPSHYLLKSQCNLPISLFLSSCGYLSICLFILHVYLPNCLFSSPSSCLPPHLSVYLSTWPFISLSTYPLICLTLLYPFKYSLSTSLKPKR